MKVNDIVEIFWIDSCSDAGWKTAIESKGVLSSVRSVGYLLEQTEDLVCIARSMVTEEGHCPYGDLLTIPKVAIKSMKHIND